MNTSGQHILWKRHFVSVVLMFTWLLTGFLCFYVQKAPAAPHPPEQRIVTIQPAEEEDGMIQCNNNNNNCLWCSHHDQSHYESHQVHLMNADWAPGGRQPSDQASWLGLWVHWKLAATIHIHLAIVIITQPVGWYSFYCPTKGGRLSRPRHCSKGAHVKCWWYTHAQAVYRTSCRDKHNRLQCHSNLSHRSQTC